MEYRERLHTDSWIFLPPLLCIHAHTGCPENFGNSRLQTTIFLHKNFRHRFVNKVVKKRDTGQRVTAVAMATIRVWNTNKSKNNIIYLEKSVFLYLVYIFYNIYCCGLVRQHYRTTKIFEENLQNFWDTLYIYTWKAPELLTGEEDPGCAFSSRESRASDLGKRYAPLLTPYCLGFMVATL